MANKYYTVLIVPEKTSQVRKLVLPAWLIRGSVAAFLFAIMIGGVMIFDYWYVMNQISENKELKLENRRLRQQVQVFKNKLTTVESTMERVKAFTTRLRVITNIEDRGGLLQSLNQKLPEANKNIPGLAQNSFSSKSETPNPQASAAAPGAPTALSSAAQLAQMDTAMIMGINPEDLLLQREYNELDRRFSLINEEALTTEQALQDMYELLADQKAFLAALPTKKPAIGYFTSGFGVRRSPYGDRVKMHEGLDIANRPGTDVFAPADGTVVFADVKSGYGQTLILDHGYGLETWYAHNSKLLVQKGQRVRRGERITKLGNSGRSTGPHLHYEVRFRGLPIDPYTYILEN